jgi:CelD/BcsL family acetyltransferase involved in cellulose biosynthesis
MTKEIKTVELDQTGEKINDTFPVRTGQEIFVEIVRSVDGFLNLAREWNDLVFHSDATVCQTHEWLYSWWTHFGTGRNRSLYIITFLRDRSVIGIAPFFLEVTWFSRFRVNRRLRLMGGEVMNSVYAAVASKGGPSDYQDIIALPEEEKEVADELAQFLKEHRHVFDEIECANVSEESVLFKSVLPALHRRMVSFTLNAQDVCPRLRVPLSFDELLKSLAPDIRHRLRRCLKDFHESPPRSIETVNTPADFDSAFKDLIALHQMRWRHLGYLGLFADERFERFQHEVGKKFLEQGWLWFKCAYWGGIRIGARMGFIFKERMYDYLSGFDDRQPWSKSRPGLALLALMISDTIQSDCLVVDFLRGAEQYKFDFTHEMGRNWILVISFLNERNILHRFLVQFQQKIKNNFCKIKKEVLIAGVHVNEYGVYYGCRAYARFFFRRSFSRFHSDTSIAGKTITSVQHEKISRISEQ